MRILVVPDKFKGTLSAERAAHALVRGARNVHPEAAFVIRPIGDGGEGTVEAFVTATGGRVIEVRVRGPLDASVDSPIALLEGGRAVIEMASASGLALVDPDSSPALRAHTYGTGELLKEALALPGIRQVIVGVGGSASTDGGTGAARAFGWRFLDDVGAELGLGGGDLERLARIEAPVGRLPPIEIVAACDVDNPLVGARGSAQVFAPQKGATPEEVTRLERGLQRLADVVEADLGTDVSTIASGGAGGGMGAGLVAFFGAGLRPGLELLAEVTGLADEIGKADLVITGEGRLDSDSLGGKAPIAIARIAKGMNKPCVAVAGDLVLASSELRRNGIEAAIGLLQSGGAVVAERDPESALEKAIDGLLRLRLEKRQGRRLRR